LFKVVVDYPAPERAWSTPATAARPTRRPRSSVWSRSARRRRSWRCARRS
jgi:hypothetical protein